MTSTALPPVIALTTPDGNVGRHLTRMLVRAGVRPRLLTRHPDRTPAELRSHVEVVETDLRDASAVARATRGVHALHWVSPSPTSDDPVGEYVRYGEVVADAVRANGIGHVVFQSSIGAEARSGFGEIDGLGRTEELLEATGASVLHLRCGYFFSNLRLEALRTGVVEIALPPTQRLPWVAPRDIAEVSAGRLLTRSWSGRLVQAVHGPADLSWEEAMAVVTGVTGLPVRVTEVSDDEMRATLTRSGLGPGLVEAILGMSTGLRDGFVAEQPRSMLSTTPTTLAAWAIDELAQTTG